MKKLICFLLLFLMSVTSYAENANEMLNQSLKKMHSMKADFVQTILNKKGQPIQKSRGQMYLKRPSQFRWEVVRPNKQIIVTNGKRLWIYDPDLEQVTIRSLVRAAGETPALLLSDENLSLGKEFKISEIPSTGKLKWFLLVPTDETNVISALKLGFLNQEIKQMHLKDHLGHTTTIEFTNIVANKSLPSSLFVFKPPARVDIIDETKQKKQ